MKRLHLLLFACVISSLFLSCKDEDADQVTYKCVDFSGKEYITVVIGDQVWMAENLATKLYNDGGDITNWNEARFYPNRNLIPQFAFFNNNTTYRSYGLLYNYLAVIDEKLVPDGWRIPTRADWEELENYVKTHPAYDSINWVGKALASSTEWTNSNVVGSIGYQKTINNKFGFNVIPAGYLTEYGSFYNDLKESMFWTSTVDTETTNLQVAVFKYNTVGIQWETLDKEKGGCYIRCIKDSTTIN